MNRAQLGIDEIVSQLAKELVEEDREYISKMTMGHLHQLHHGFGTHIRNSFGLWTENPLTEKWRTDESSRDIRGDVDYSVDHPDAVSMMIIDNLWKHLSEQNEKSN